MHSSTTERSWKKKNPMILLTSRQMPSTGRYLYMPEAKEYVKINSLWKRRGCDLEKVDRIASNAMKNAHEFIVGEYACPEFGNIRKWHVEEKVDGTNIRIIYRDGNVSFAGRTKDAQLPPHLLKYLQDTFTDFTMHK